MSSKRVRLISLTGIIMIVLIIGVSLLLNYISKDTRNIPLPATSAPGSTDNGPASPANNGLQHVEITKDNVQAVIATLFRRENYTRHIKIVSTEATGSTTYDIEASVLGQATSLQVLSDGIKKNIIVTADKLYIWYDDDKTYYERPITSSEDEKRSSDEYQMIMSYEDVLALDKNSITDAGYQDFNNERCIYVEYVSALLQYKTICYVSVDTGLLTGAQQYSKGALIYDMVSSNYNSAEPGASVFNLPDGENALIAP